MDLVPDYARPVTAAEACVRLADEFKANAERLRLDAALLLARAEVMETARNCAEDEAARYEKWQGTDDSA